MSTSSKTATGDPTEYSDADEAFLVDALDAAWEDWVADRTPSRMTVSSVVEWSGSINKAHGGARTVRLDGLDLAPVRAKLEDARAATRAVQEAREYRTYDAKGWHAQINALTRSARGSELADRAGLNPSARTLATWLAEGRAPSKANQEKIAQAYAGLRTWGVDQARREQSRAYHEASQAITAAVRERYGAEVRFTNIRTIRFGD